MTNGFECRTCGEYHAELPMEFGAEAPALYLNLSPEEQERCELTEDVCVVDEKFFFLRGRLQLPVIDGDEPFTWGVWASLSKDSFQQTLANWDRDGRESMPPLFGWISTAIPLYPETIHLKSHVITQPIGFRPLIELEPTDHPLSIEQRNGITIDRVRQIAEAVLHQADAGG